jgi:hypothetical protein
MTPRATRRSARNAFARRARMLGGAICQRRRARIVLDRERGTRADDKVVNGADDEGERTPSLQTTACPNGDVSHPAVLFSKRTPRIQRFNTPVANKAAKQAHATLRNRAPVSRRKTAAVVRSCPRSHGTTTSTKKKIPPIHVIAARMWTQTDKT